MPTGAIINGTALSASPSTARDLTYGFTFSGVAGMGEYPPCIVQLFGHRQASATRL